ncbi:MAG: RluA family pseudouridine synthase, partial [Candidatus Omnitrophica bacterium]|nr:RluA family pseudouridine synthase [Candidatus Omnitrophota bacterium]
KKYPDRVWAVHRLDRDTSGVVLFARSPLALKSLHDQFQQHTLRKVYHAILEGVIAKGGGVINSRVERSTKWTEGRVAKSGEGQSARTDFSVMERFQRYTLVEARPLTGRFHQLRIHFRQIGHPLAYDPTYNPDGNFLMKRVPLHASRILLQHPETRRPLEIGCPWADDFSKAVDALRRAV